MKKYQALANHLAERTILGNAVLSALKLAAGLAGHSGAMVSDAVHSLSDVFTTVVAWYGARVSVRDADREHPYGHERFECVASLVLGAILALTGFALGWSGVENIVHRAYATAEPPTMLPLVAAVLSILVKEGMYHYTMFYAREMNSEAFRADAWHHRSDALSSVGALVGIAAARFGAPVMDPVASVVICLFVLKMAFDVVRHSLAEMMDTSCDAAYEARIETFIKTVAGVGRVDLLHTRTFGNRVYVDVEIAVARDSSLLAAHEIAETVHTGIETNFPAVKHVMVHVNPL